MYYEESSLCILLFSPYFLSLNYSFIFCFFIGKVYGKFGVILKPHIAKKQVLYTSLNTPNFSVYNVNQQLQYEYIPLSILTYYITDLYYIYILLTHPDIGELLKIC